MCKKVVKESNNKVVDPHRMSPLKLDGQTSPFADAEAVDPTEPGMIMRSLDYSPLNSHAITLKASARKILDWDQKCQKHAKACRSHAQATGKYAVKIGLELESIKNKIPHGLWHHWLESECDYTVRTAQFYMSIAEKFKCATAVAHLGSSVLGFLASDSVPQAARDEAIERSSDGEHISRSTVRRIVDAHTVPLDQSAIADDGKKGGDGKKNRAKAESAMPVLKSDTMPDLVAIEPKTKTAPSPFELMNQILELAKQLSNENACRVGRAMLRLYEQKVDI